MQIEIVQHRGGMLHMLWKIFRGGYRYSVEGKKEAYLLQIVRQGSLSKVRLTKWAPLGQLHRESFPEGCRTCDEEILTRAPSAGGHHTFGSA